MCPPANIAAELVAAALPPVRLAVFKAVPEAQAPVPAIAYLSASPVLLYHTVPAASEAVGSAVLVTTFTPLIPL